MERIASVDLTVCSSDDACPETPRWVILPPFDADPLPVCDAHVWAWAAPNGADCDDFTHRSAPVVGVRCLSVEEFTKAPPA